MHTSDSLFIASRVKSVSHQSHLDRMWQLVMAHKCCLDNPLKENRFLRCVNPVALEGEGKFVTIQVASAARRSAWGDAAATPSPP
jgi:hypothetical protein